MKAMPEENILGKRFGILVSLSYITSHIEYALVLAILATIPLAAGYLYINLPGTGGVGASITLLAGAVVGSGLFFAVPRAAAFFKRTINVNLTLWAIVLAGVVFQVFVAVLTSPSPTHDAAAYLHLAQELASGLDYVDAQGFRAFFPPGLPLFLTPFIWLFKTPLLAVVIANLLLYILGAMSIWYLARHLISAKAAVIATVLFTAWPSRLLLAGVAAKELLTLTAILAFILFALKSLDGNERRYRRHAALSGVSVGMAGLAQPGLMLLAVVFPLMFRHVLLQMPIKKALTCIALVVLAAFAVMSTWSARNFLLFDGQFYGISTNGGSVFYRANNEKATGLWVGDGAVPISRLPEVQQDKVGFVLGKKWIFEHPAQAAMLSIRKLFYFLGEDDQGVYSSVFNGDGETRAALSGRQKQIFESLNALSLLYWLALTTMCMRGVLAYGKRSGGEFSAITPLLYPLLYGAAIFSIFESGSRQHMFAVGPLFLIAIIWLFQKRPRTGTLPNP